MLQEEQAVVEVLVMEHPQQPLMAATHLQPIEGQVGEVLTTTMLAQMEVVAPQA
jgi:hypothetical protein